jgi:hypothetical protein
VGQRLERKNPQGTCVPFYGIRPDQVFGASAGLSIGFFIIGFFIIV